MKLLVAVLVAVAAGPCLALDNGLGLTPPMGWLTWERFRCNIDCVNDPDNCIGEKLIKDMADRMAADGFKEAGYEYVIVDDCWLAKERDENRRLQPDPDRFPSGIKALADYVHSKGLKFGIYEDFGTKTCGGYPGSEYYLQLDAQTFADWGVDYLKLDGCYSEPSQFDDGYPPMAFYLNMTKRPMYFSCEYPLHQLVAGYTPNYTAVAIECNMARNYNDVDDSWDSVKSIIDFFGKDQNNFSSVVKPGYFNDPDMLILGNFGLSHDQERVQMGMWAMMASPLIMSTDLRALRNSSKALLTNMNLIAINQDKKGIQGTRLQKSGNIQVWTRPLSSSRVAFAFLNEGNADPSKVSIKMSDLGLTNPAGYSVSEGFTAAFIDKFLPNATMTTYVNPSGIFMGVATPL